MQLYILDYDPKKAAEYLADSSLDRYVFFSHVILRIISKTIMRKNNRLSAIEVWARTSKENCRWMLTFIKAIVEEFHYRKGSYPKNIDKINRYLPKVNPNGYRSRGFTPFPLVNINPEDIVKDPVATYRISYFVDRRHYLVWRKRKPPQWWMNMARKQMKKEMQTGN